MKKALITGITGQDGSFLAEYLIKLGYDVHGIIRRSSSFNTGRIEFNVFTVWGRVLFANCKTGYVCMMMLLLLFYTRV